jgi:hypothetical protein
MVRRNYYRLWVAWTNITKVEAEPFVQDG